MSNEVVDLDAAEWLMDNGTVLSNETVRAIIGELKVYRAIMDDYCKNGCGYVECGMAESGFSNMNR